MAHYVMDANGRLVVKKKEEEKEKKQTGNHYYMDSTGKLVLKEKEIDSQLAPTSKKKEKDSKLDFFKKSSYFDDGYQLGDFSKALTQTVADASLSALEGIAGMGEGILDLGGHIIAGGADLLGADNFADDLRKVANHNTVAEAADWIRDIGGEYGIGEGSVLGRTSQAIGQGAGQIAGILLTGGLGQAAGLSGAAATALTSGTMFASSTGAGISEAYNDGASDAEAWAYGTLKGGIDAASELIFGGLGKGVKALGISHGLSSADDILAKKLSSKISSKVAKTMVQAGVKASAEGFEEVLAGLGTAAAKMIYKDGVSYQQLLEDENLLEQFVVGAFSSGLAQSGGVVNSIKTGTDFISGMTANEETVVNKEVEKRIAQEEESGNKLSNKEKNAIYESVVAGMDKGYISTDTIEEALGGDTFKAYQDAVKSEDAIKKEYEKLANTPKGELTHIQEKRLAELEAQIEAEPKSKALKQQLQTETFELAKGSRLVETYNEQARRTQAFQADLTKYEGLEKESIQKIISKGQMQNTNRAHDVVDFAVKTAAGRGLTVTTATTEEILARETEKHGEDYVRENFYTKVEKDGKVEWKLTTIPNAFIDGKELTLNVNSPRLSRALIGHEIGHSFEGTKYYDTLAKLLNSYDESVKGKEAYDARKVSFEAKYKRIKGANAKYELNAELLGEYIFSDEKFVKHLTQDRNVFQKVFDEIKYMLKMATAGSQQQRDLLRIKHTFEKAWRESQVESKQADAKHSLSDIDNNYQLDYNRIGKEGEANGSTGKSEQSGTRVTGISEGRTEVNDKRSARTQGQGLDSGKNIGAFQELLKVDEESRQKLNNKGVTDNEFWDSSANPELFSFALESGKTSNPNGIMVDSHTAQDLRENGVRTFLSKDNLAGGAVEPNGNITGVFKNNNSKSKFAGADIILTALENGGTKLDCYGDGLLTLYSRLGFEPVAKVKFNPEYAHEGWDFDKFGTPDIYVMKHNGKSVSEVVDDYVNDTAKIYSPDEIASLPYMEYDDAMEYRDSLISTGTRFSLSADTAGNKLTKGQQEYFRDSKVVDADGNLKVMYHGSNAQFTTFDRSKSKGSGLYGKGFYFTDSDTHAKTYGNLYSVYLNIRNPLKYGETTVSRDQVREYLNAVAENEDYSIENYGTYDVEEVLNKIMGKASNMDAFQIIQDINATAIGDMVEAAELFNSINGTSFDGIVVPTETVAFYPEQIKSTANKNPTANTDTRFSLSEAVEETNDSDIYSRVYDLQVEVGKLNREIREYEDSAEFKAENAQINEAFGKGDIDYAIKQYQHWMETSKYGKLKKQRDDLQSTLEILIKERDGLYANEAEAKEKAAIEKSGLSEAEYFRKQAVKEFGYTPFFYDAGYIVPNGKMLNFSGEKGKHFGTRGQDHRGISIIYENTQGSEAMVRFMNDGNIRIMGETPGIDISAKVKPTNEQYALIRKFVRESANKEYFAVDISDEQGNNIGTYDYEGRVNAERVVNDIKYFFENGKIRESSGITDFLSLSNVDEEIAPSGNDVPMRDLALQEDIAPVQETVQEDIAPVREDARVTTEDVFSDDPTMIAPDNTMDRLQSFTDADAPIFAEPVTDSIPSEVADPFAHKDIKEVGQRNVKAFMSENPDIKPFFQAEANNLLGELERTVKGKRYYSEEGGYTGTSRHTSEDMAYMLDELKMSYKDIEASLKAIISGEGNINRAGIKRIEFIINDRLMKGYTDFETGAYVQPNQQYINALDQMQQMEAYQDSIGNLMEIADEIAPTQETRQNLKAEIPIKHLAERAETIEEKKPILNVQQRMEAKLKNLQNELAEIERQRQESWAGFDADIADLKAQYNEKKNKNTQTANNLILRIERTETRKQNTDDLYNKRINSVKEKIAKVQEEIKTGESPTEQAAFRAEYYERIIENIKTAFADKGYDFDAVLEKAKDLSTIATVDNTPQRVLEKSLGYKEGQILSDLTVNKLAQDETMGIKWLNAYLDKKNGELVKISKEYNIKPYTKESAAAQMYAEGFFVNDQNEIVAYKDRELAMDFPDANVRNNIKKLAKDTRIRQIYDETLDLINESRVRNGYPEIKKLDNYFLHFRAQTDTFSRLGIPFNPNDIKAKDLPTDLNGVTADLKPGQPYFASSMHRKGQRTSFDLLGGLEQYLTAAKNQIFHIDNIQTLRALRNYIADTYGQAKGLENLDLLTEEEAEARIKEVYGAHLSTFAKFLNEEANVIAGKTALIDRGLEGIIGRRGITLLDSLNKQVGANMIGFNISSSLTNLIAPVQAFAKTNKAAFVKAMAQTASNRLKSIKGQSDGFMETNPAAIRRRGADRFARTPWQKVSDVGYVFMSAVDSVSTELITRAKYNEYISKGMTSEQAHIEADKWASRLMGDRSLGQQPQLFNSRMLGMFTKFQLEVRNQLDAQFYDTIQEAKLSNEDIENRLKRNAKTAAKATKTFVELAVLQHLFGKAFESVAGYNPAFDIISAIIKAFGWDDDEEDDDTITDNLWEGAQELLGDLPYTSTLTGGRIPISSALPTEQFITGKDSYGNDKSRWETLTEALPYYVLPGGYGQIKKTTQGLSMFDDDLPIAGSYTDSGNLRFPVEKTFGNVAQAALFGQYASKNARDYFDNEYAPLKEKQIQEFIDLDIPIKEYREIREDLADKSTLGEKVAYIATLDLPIDKKNILVNNAANREEPIDMSDYGEYDDWGEFDYAKKYPDKYAFLQENGISAKDYKNMDKDTQDAWNWAYQNPEKYSVAKVSASDLVTYRQYTKALGNLEADKDEEGKSISGSRKEKVIAYINSIDADYGSKIILFKSEYPADDTYNQAIVEYVNNRQDITYEDRVAIFTELGFTIKNGSVYWD